MKTRIIGLLLFLSVIIGAIWCGGGAAHFVHFPALAYVIIVAGGLALMKYRKGDGNAAIIKAVKKYVIFAGLFGFLTGFIQMARLGLDSTKLLGGFGIAVLVIFYALIFYCILDTFTA